MNRKKKNFLMLLILSIFVFTVLDCKSSQMVVQIRIPKSKNLLQLWERESWSVGYGKEYLTWVIIKTGNQKKKYIIDKHYITYRYIRIFYSKKDSQIRVETNGVNAQSHSIVIYNIRNNKMMIKSENTVSKKKGWILLKEKKIR